MASHSRVVRLLRDMVACPSVNPAFLPPGDRRAGEAAVAGLVASFATGAGLDVSFEEVLPGRGNVLARLAPAGPIRHRVLLAPHLDTVGEPRLDALLRPGVSSGRLTGRGACDTKGCVAAFLEALRRVAEGGRRPGSTEVLFAGFVDEENGQAGSRRHAALARREGRRTDLAIVGEPTRLEVVTAHKGDVWLQLRTQGRAAHGATPHLGTSAVVAMARVVGALETEYREALKRRTHPLLGHATINVGSIRGGTQPNIVPDSCVISLDRRTLPGEDEDLVRREIGALMKRRGLRVAFDPLRAEPCPALETDPANPWVQRLMKAAGRRRTTGVHYFCDAAPLAAGGIPSVVFGPGDIAQAHTRDEWISTASLERGTDLMERFIRGLP